MKLAILDHLSSGCKHVAKHALNFPFKEVNIAIIIEISCTKDLLPIGLLGALEIEFKLGECSVGPSFQVMSSQSRINLKRK
jgi:hypothetical protein